MQAAELREDARQLEALLFAREYLYTLFHKLMGGTPDAPMLEALLDDVTADVLEEYAADSQTLAGALAFLETLRNAERAELLDAVREEYTRVLIGPANLPASPYESPYTGAHDESLFQENTLVVRACYHAHGLRVRREQAVPDDHISLMCAFAAELARRSRELADAGKAEELACLLRDQSAFVERHMKAWLPVYATAVRNSKAGARAVLYPQLLEALAAFVEADATFLLESAYWVESNGGALSACGPLEELAAAQEALESLRGLRLFGLQDNELVSL